MLGHTYRYQVANGTGVSVTVTVAERAWKWASDGSRTNASESVRISAVSVSSASYSNSSTVDNSSGKNVGADLVVTMAPGSSATGAVYLWLQKSTDAGTTWPSDGQGELLMAQFFSASSTSVTRNAQVD